MLFTWPQNRANNEREKSETRIIAMDRRKKRKTEKKPQRTRVTMSGGEKRNK